MDCKNCYEKKRADYWHGVSEILFTIIGGILGGTVGYLVISLFCN